MAFDAPSKCNSVCYRHGGRYDGKVYFGTNIHISFWFFIEISQKLYFKGFHEYVDPEDRSRFNELYWGTNRSLL